ncbi:MAG TPA: hypothetical protein VLD35_06270 [Caldimonas sp.]|nr:hypothetical protein [Caldimonas sp.]
MPLPRTGIATASDAGHVAKLIGALLVAALVIAPPHVARAAEPSGRPIIQCDLNGKKVTSDRPIPECVHKEQRELNPDGSLKRIVPPTPTADEVAAKEQQDQVEKLQAAARSDAVRRDRNLMQRFPDEAAHRKAREKALDELRIAGKIYADRIAVLLADRKKLDDEKQFYVNDRVNKPLPTQLKQKIDANDASLEAQRSLAQNQVAETDRINALYDAELARLKKLWSGAQPGSLGPLPGTQPLAGETAKSAAPPAAVTARTPDASGKTTLK